MFNGPMSGMSTSSVGQKAPAINGQLNQYHYQPHSGLPPFSVGSHVPQPPLQLGVANAMNQPLQRPPVSSNGGDHYFDQETGSWTAASPPQPGQGSQMQNQAPPSTGMDEIC